MSKLTISLLVLFSFLTTWVKGLEPDSLIFKIDSIVEPILLNQYWRYHPGDDKLWADPDFDDSEWDTLQTSIDLTKVSEEQFNGKGWFRLHIQIDSSLRNKTLVYKIFQHGASEIYLNGELISNHGIIGTEDEEEKTYNPNIIPHLIEFEDSVDYVLAIRYSNIGIRDLLQRYNIEEEPFSLAGFKIELLKYEWARDHFFDFVEIRYILLSILMVFLFISFLHLLLFLFYRRQKFNLFFSLFMLTLSSIFILLLSLISSSYEPIKLLKLGRSFEVISSMIMPFLALFIYSFFYKKLPRFSRYNFVIISLIIILYILQPKWMDTFISIVVLLISLDIIRILIIAITKKKKGVWLLSITFIFFTTGVIIITIFEIVGGGEELLSENEPILIVFFLIFLLGVISIPIIMSVYLARDFARTNRDLAKQIINVRKLSAKTIKQEKEKQRILENQKEKLEKMVDERTEELSIEKEKTEELLLNTLPVKVVNDLKQNGKSEPESFEDVTVYFSDIVGFTSISSQLEPKLLIEELNEVFTAFDEIMEKHNCERIKTIGDAYLAVSGMPVRDKNHAENMVRSAMEIKQFMEQRNKASQIKWLIRIGIHSGKVVGGIVGVKKYIYDVFGDTINTTSRMESNSEPMRINVSETTYLLLKDIFNFTPRDPIIVKGKGKMKMFFLEG